MGLIVILVFYVRINKSIMQKPNFSKLIFLFIYFSIATSCQKKTVEVIIDSKTKKFERIMQPSGANVHFLKFSWYILGSCNDTVKINGSKILPGEIDFHSGPNEFYGDPPIKVFYDPLNASIVNIKIVYNFY